MIYMNSIWVKILAEGCFGQFLNKSENVHVLSLQDGYFKADIRKYLFLLMYQLVRC